MKISKYANPGEANPAYTHGFALRGKLHPIYKAWASMKDRINSPHRYPGYAHLDYDKEWGTFDGFLKDMGNSWSEKLTLDRIDNSKGYSKENCRWATKSIQAMNQRRNKKHTYNGKEYFLKELSDLSGIKYGVLRDRLNKLGWSVELALSVPSNSRGGVGITKKLKYDLSNKKLG